MLNHSETSTSNLYSQIRSGRICFGGNVKLKIYGTLRCKSGKRMKMQNRVFFTSENVAVLLGYRPCGLCMNKKYRKWKAN